MQLNEMDHTRLWEQTAAIAMFIIASISINASPCHPVLVYTIRTVVME